MTPEAFVAMVTQGGVIGVLGAWLWSERKERLRLQRVIEGFLPLMAGTARAMQNVSRVVGGEKDE